MSRKKDEKQSKKVKSKLYEEQDTISNRKRYVMKCAVQRNKEQKEGINCKQIECLIL